MSLDPTEGAASALAFLEAEGRSLAACIAAADGGATTRDLLELEARTLEPIEGAERSLWLAAMGPATSHGVEAGGAYAEVRGAALVAGERLLADALAGRLRDAGSLERLWTAVSTGGGGAHAFVAAAALAIGGALPLQLTDAAKVLRVGDPVVSSLLGLAIGCAGRGGDLGAMALARSLLADGTGPCHLVVGLLKGLGAGLWRDGLAWLASYGRAAAFAPEEWSKACLRASLLAMPATPRPALELLRVGLGAVGGEDTARTAILGALDAIEPDLRPALIEDLMAGWSDWSSETRAALVSLDELGFERPCERWLGERSAAVVLAMLDRLADAPDRADASLCLGLARGWADHPDVEVQRRLARTLRDASGVAVAADPPATPGEVVGMPPAALVRGPLDELHVALWTGDSDAVTELAPHVPGELRLAAREALFAAIDVPNAALRRACVHAISVVGQAADGGRLMDVARGYRALEGTVAAALRALDARAQAEPLAELYRRRLKWADDDAVDDYCALAGPEQVMHLLGALDTRFYPGARAGAARAIARVGAHEVVFALRRCGLCDTQQGARSAALGALFELTGSAPSPDEIAGYALLFRSSSELPAAVERARAAGRAALPGLRRTLSKGSWRRRRAACDALAGIRVAEAEQALLGALVDPDEDVRVAAIQALLARGWEPRTRRAKTLTAIAARRFEALLEHPEEIDLQALEQGLRLGGFVARAEIVAVLEAVPGWSPSRDSAPWVLAARLDGDASLAVDPGASALLEAVDRTWQADPHRYRLARSLRRVAPSVLAERLGEGGWAWRAREAMCQALARPGHEGGLAALAARVDDDDDDVRRAALEALVRVGTPAAAEAVAGGFASAFQEDREAAAAALATMGPVALDVLTRLVHDRWWERRQGAAMTLARWRSARQIAADLLIELAVDSEYRVNQPAREGLDNHGLVPSVDAVRRALVRAQLSTADGLERWLTQGAHALLSKPEGARWFRELLEQLPPDSLPHRLGLVPLLGAGALSEWLEDLALGRATRHVGVRLAAAEALRGLNHGSCRVCYGEGAVRCPECDGEGDRACPICGGDGEVLVACPEPDCTARQTTRRIDSRRCPACRGRGQVVRACSCASAVGRVACDLCDGSGRIRCLSCNGRQA